MKSFMAVALLVLSSHSLAKPLNVEALQACALVENDFKRLMCYDNIIQGKQLTTSNTADKAVTAATKQVNTSDKKAEFGLENRIKPEVEQITAKVTSLSKTVSGKQVYRLDNNQVWKQTGKDDLLLESGDSVVISRAAFGSFLMKKQGTNRTTRVKRTK